MALKDRLIYNKTYSKRNSKMMKQEVTTCILHKNTDLTMLYGPKYLYDRIKIQLKSFSTKE